MNKLLILDKIRESLRADLVVAQRVARETAAAANHPEARPENDKDTRKIELSYLAAGQAARAQALEASIAHLAGMPLRSLGKDEPIRVGALVELDVGGKEQRVFLCPAGGGSKIRDDRGDISVVTPEAPLGRGLLGKTVGDSFELTIAGKVLEVEIVSAT